jgi:hypothetical protein
MNHFDILLNELELAADRKANNTMHKAQVAEYDELMKALQPKDTRVFDAKLRELQSMNKSLASQVKRIKKNDQAEMLKSFPKKLKAALMAKSISPMEAVKLEAEYNKLMLSARESKRQKNTGMLKSFPQKLKQALMAKSITPNEAMMLEIRYNNLTIGGMQ